MNMSEHGSALLTQWEGFETKVYKDSVGLPTIGVGHLLTPVERTAGRIVIKGTATAYANGLTESQVRDLLVQDLGRFEKAVTDSVSVALDQNQFDALVSFCFNVGIENFRKSTLLQDLNKGNFADVPDGLRRWTMAGGEMLSGLANRRESEIKLWFGEL